MIHPFAIVTSRECIAVLTNRTTSLVIFSWDERISFQFEILKYRTRLIRHAQSLQSLQHTHSTPISIAYLYTINPLIHLRLTIPSPIPNHKSKSKHFLKRRHPSKQAMTTRMSHSPIKSFIYPSSSSLSHKHILSSSISTVQRRFSIYPTIIYSSVHRATP